MTERTPLVPQNTADKNKSDIWTILSSMALLVNLGPLAYYIAFLINFIFNLEGEEFFGMSPPALALGLGLAIYSTCGAIFTQTNINTNYQSNQTNLKLINSEIYLTQKMSLLTKGGRLFLWAGDVLDTVLNKMLSLSMLTHLTVDKKLSRTIILSIHFFYFLVSGILSYAENRTGINNINFDKNKNESKTPIKADKWTKFGAFSQVMTFPSMVYSLARMFELFFRQFFTESNISGFTYPTLIVAFITSLLIEAGTTYCQFKINLNNQIQVNNDIDISKVKLSTMEKTLLAGNMIDWAVYRGLPIYILIKFLNLEFLAKPLISDASLVGALVAGGFFSISDTRTAGANIKTLKAIDDMSFTRFSTNTI